RRRRARRTAAVVAERRPVRAARRRLLRAAAAERAPRRGRVGADRRLRGRHAAAMSAPAAPARASMPWSMLLLAVVLQTAATPPAWGSCAPRLVFPGLAAQFALASGERRPLLATYLAGVLHVGAFSWSLRHFALPGWAAIALTGGLYWLLAAV